jgi:PAS domain S-box-containing protein
MGNHPVERNLCQAALAAAALVGLGAGTLAALGVIEWADVGVVLTFGSILLLLGTLRIARRTRLELARRAADLAQKQALLETVLEQLPAGVIVLDAEGRVLRKNRHYHEILGLPADWPAARIDELQDSEITAPDGTRLPFEEWPVMRAITRGESTHEQEVRIHRLDGGWTDVSITSAPFSDPNGRRLGAVSLLADLADRKRSEQRLRLLESAVVNARDAVIVLEADPCPGQGRAVLYVNEAFTRMTGYTTDEVLGRSLHFLRGADTNPATLNKLRSALDTQTPLHTELLNYRKDGSELWVDLSLVPVIDAAGRCTHWVMIQRDIGDRKRADAALRASEELFRSVFENAGAGVSLIGPHGRFTSVNPAFAAMVGRPAAEIVGKTAQEFTHPDDWAEQGKLLKEVASGMRDEYHIRKRYIRPNGEYVWTELTVAVVRGPNRDIHYSLGVSVDVTMRQHLEDQLRQAQKMEVVGQLAGGIAHDFNNLLTGVIGNLDQVCLPPDDPNADLIAAAERAAERAADLTRKMLGFARKNQLHVTPCKVGEFVDEVLTLLRRTLDPRIRVVAEVDGDPWVTADATLMNQALLNLCLNARDAMTQGGTLTVRAAAVEVAPADTIHPDARTGLYARLTVADTGVGMSPEVRARLFEPFFTTKEVGKGTGLGLAMVHGIARQHGGWVECDSAPGLGTRFDVFLPLLPAAAIPTRPAPERNGKHHPVNVDTPVPGAVRTILLVDDEDMIRELGRSVLEGAGYQVLVAHDGSHAVELFRRDRAAIDLVVLDLTMPKLSGRDAYRLMAEIDPDARVLFSSGYSSDDLSDLPGSVTLLAKPYRPHELLTAVRNSLATTTALSVPTG